jgi:hypothetical protein
LRARIGATKPKQVYLSLCIAGTLIPYAAVVSWLGAHGLNLRLFVKEIFANRISVFFALDVLVSAVVVVVFAAVERQRMQLRLRWMLLPALLLVGVSLALPLLLYLRESALESRPHALASAAE